LVEGVEIGQRSGLVGHGVGDFASSVPEIDAPQAGDGVEIAAPVGIRHPDAFAALYDLASLALEGCEIRVRMNKVIVILLPDLAVRMTYHGAPLIAAHTVRRKGPRAKVTPWGYADPGDATRNL